jgi:hypothetical protein
MIPFYSCAMCIRMMPCILRGKSSFTHAFCTSVVAEAVLMIGGCAQGHLGTAILLGVDQGPTAQATRQHLSESTIQGTTCFHPPPMCWWKLRVLVMSQFNWLAHLPSWQVPVSSTSKEICVAFTCWQQIKECEPQCEQVSSQAEISLC